MSAAVAKMRLASRAVLAWAAVTLAACDAETRKASATIRGPIKYEEACNVAGLSKPLRQTVLVIDQQSIVRAQPSEFRAKNPGVIEAVMAITDPEQAVDLGALAPRERVSLYVAPADGSPPRLMFAGCAPALSAAERAQLASGSSAAERGAEWFFASGTADKLKAQADEFRTRLLGAVQQVAQSAPDKPARPAQSFESAPAIRSLKTSAGLADPLFGLPRLVLIAPAALRAVPPSADVETARRAGFVAAERAGLDLGMAEVAVTLARGGANRDFVEAFLLGSRGRLAAWSTGALTDVAAAPASVRNFSGTIQYGPVQFPMRVRLAVDREGRLSNSWIMVMNEQEAATPLSGNAACDQNGDCKITGDGRGFAQSWSPRPGGEPEFGAEIPFSGLRYFEIAIARGRAKGRVYDPLVDQVGSQRDLPFELTEVAS